MSETTYSVLLHFVSATNVPIADFLNLSADPYISASISCPSKPRPKEEPELKWRTHSVHATRDPTWNDVWVVAGIPAEGFTLRMMLVDEDAKDRDDRLGRAELEFTREMMQEGFELENREIKVQKRRGSILPYIMTYAAGVLPGQRVRKHTRIVLSAKVLQKTTTKQSYRSYTLGPVAYSQHFSSLIGSVINRKNQGTKGEPVQQTGNENKPAAASSFVANKFQFRGPVPPELHFRYVGYNAFIKLLYSRRGIAGRILFQGLRKQYRTVYSYDKNTLYGEVLSATQKDEAEKNEKPLSLERYLCDDAAAIASQFLKMAHYGRGGRLMTYVLTLDGEWHFCETGDEFSIDFLSKHMMHADGEQFVAYAGEFFVRRIKEGNNEGEQQRDQNDTSNDNTHESDQDFADDDDDPSHYELIIDNDSGTYRPPEETLPILQSWLGAKERLGGLGRVTAMHAFDENLQDLKKQRKELKKRIAGGEIPKRQQVQRMGSSVSSLRVDGRKMSSSEVERIVEEAKETNDGKLGAPGNGDVGGTSGMNSTMQEGNSDAKTLDATEEKSKTNASTVT